MNLASGFHSHTTTAQDTCFTEGHYDSSFLSLFSHEVRQIWWVIEQSGKGIPVM